MRKHGRPATASPMKTNRPKHASQTRSARRAIFKDWNDDASNSPDDLNWDFESSLNGLSMGDESDLNMDGSWSNKENALGLQSPKRKGMSGLQKGLQVQVTPSIMFSPAEPETLVSPTFETRFLLPMEQMSLETNMSDEAPTPEMTPRTISQAFSPDPNVFAEQEHLFIKPKHGSHKKKAVPQTPDRNLRPHPRFMSRQTSLEENKFLATMMDASELEKDFEDPISIGLGAFFTVFSVTAKHTGKRFAIKKSIKAAKGKMDRNEYTKEVTLWARVCGQTFHPNIVQYFSSWQEERHIYIQMELCDSTLTSYVERDTFEMSTAFLLSVCLQMSRALAHVHKADVAHLDVKPDNILIVENKQRSQGIPTLKLADFGQALQKSDWPTVYGREGDSTYLAGELLTATAVASPACDIFALGLIIFELATGLVLPTEGALWHKLRQGKAADMMLDSKNEVAPKMTNLIFDMLHPDPLLRPSANDLITRVSGMIKRENPMMSPQLLKQPKVTIKRSPFTGPLFDRSKSLPMGSSKKVRPLSPLDDLSGIDSDDDLILKRIKSESSSFLFPPAPVF